MKNPKDIMIGDRTLAEVLERHKHWLNQDCDGWKDMRAILRGSDLSDSNLRGSDLSGSNLRGSDLSGSDLRGSDLRGSNLSGSDLRGSDLRGSDLSGSDLRRSNLSDSNLRGSDLSGSNLRGSDLSGSDLSGSDLSGSNLSDSDLRGSDLSGSDLRRSNLSDSDLRNARNSPYIPMICPEEGSFIGWKQARVNGKACIVKLEIPEDAQRSSATSRKCRASKARVVGIYTTNGEPIDFNTVGYAYSIHDPSFHYRVGESVEPDSWDDDRWNECSHGIHFFMQRQEAINY